MCKPKTKTASTIDPQIKKLMMQNYAGAQQVAAQPFTPYTGQLAPSVPQATQNAITSAQGLTSYTPQQVTAPMAQAASSGVYGLGGGGGGGGGGIASPAASPTASLALARPDVSGMAPADRRAALQNWRAQRGTSRGAGGDGGAASVSAMQGLQGLESYLNPYTQQVIDTTLADINRQNQIANVGNSQAATMSGAWGGSRHGVAEAETNRAYGDIAAQTAAGLRNQGFNTSAGLLMADKSNLLQNQQFNAGLQQQTNLANQQAGLTGALANQQAGLQGAGLNLSATNTLGNLGLQQYGMNQDALTAAYQEFLRQQNYPYQQQGLLNSTLGLFPAQSQQTLTLPPPSGGGLQGIGSIMQGAAALGPLLAASDMRLKTDISTDHFDDRGRRWVSFRYVWDEPGTKRHGVIAQEVRATDPHAVALHPSGFLMVNYSALAGT